MPCTETPRSSLPTLIEEFNTITRGAAFISNRLRLLVKILTRGSRERNEVGDRGGLLLRTVHELERSEQMDRVIENIGGVQSRRGSPCGELQLDPKNIPSVQRFLRVIGFAGIVVTDQEDLRYDRGQ